MLNRLYQEKSLSWAGHHALGLRGAGIASAGKRLAGVLPRVVTLTSFNTLRDIAGIDGSGLVVS